jgi:hypothetical protein
MADAVRLTTETQFVAVIAQKPRPFRVGGGSVPKLASILCGVRLNTTPAPFAPPLLVLPLEGAEIGKRIELRLRRAFASFQTGWRREVDLNLR